MSTLTKETKKSAKKLICHRQCLQRFERKLSVSRDRAILGRAASPPKSDSIYKRARAAWRVHPPFPTAEQVVPLLPSRAVESKCSPRSFLERYLLLTPMNYLCCFSHYPCPPRRPPWSALPGLPGTRHYESSRETFSSLTVRSPGEHGKRSLERRVQGTHR
jgi:hypothetical protein